MDYGGFLFIVQTRTTNKQTCWNIAHATKLDQWHHGTPENITQNPRNTYLFLPSDNLLPNKTHPAPGNHGWILRNMARTHREVNFKVSTRIRYHIKRAPGPAETTTSGSSGGKCNNFIHQARGAH